MRSFLHRQIHFLSGLTILGLSGCSSIDSASPTAFGTAATATEQEANTAFAQVNSLTSETIIENAAAQSSLNPANFYQVLPTAQIAQWDNAFAVMAAYAQSLSSLSTSAHTDTTTTALATLSTTIQSQVKSNSLPSMSTVFISLADALEKAKFGHDARVVAQKTDPEIQQVVQSMAEAIGATNKVGLRGTVLANYQTDLMSPLQISFASASTQDKLTLAKQFAVILNQRDAADLQLSSLRVSILALGTAHHAMVTKSSFDFASAMNTVNQQLSLTQKTLSQIQGASTAK